MAGGQVCGTNASNNDIHNERKSIEAMGNKLQGDIGEQVAAKVANEKLNLTAECFDPPHNGFDSVYRDSLGKLVIVESKLTEKGGLGALRPTNFGRQGSVEWIQHNAELMCDPYSSRYSPDNAKIGEEILRVGAENVHVVVIHTDPGTFETTIQNLR